ncbi:peptidylprolyl isomerase [Caldichromatium japonicum]|uniref:peptidylprolyl isomerase n=1 Tax=Caldichromatium japonicum TaxID=2699430 RepID=A0A6G7VBH0_9GAMM|nr:peptidylprolyl isomerase [Caldichromatium japonicum]QIK37409.1 peptidylprolyl isomerase [Caldichromatium japonicum]
MSYTICDDMFVELIYRVLDQETGEVLSAVEFPLGYVQGRNTILSPQVMAELVGKAAGDRISIPINCTALYGPRDESLVVIDRLSNVPDAYHQLGLEILMENDQGQIRRFRVVSMDDETLTLDGNHPLCGRTVVFELEILSVREASEEEIMAGGALESAPDLSGLPVRPL